MFILAIAVSIPCFLTGADELPEDWLTVAERTDFRVIPFFAVS